MKNLLSIGELAKLKGVSVKSLRYYDEIGVLKPAYVNEETGYRYYAMEQIILLDIILLCLNFQLPLKSLNEYSNNGNYSPDLKHLIIEGQEQAKKKLEESEKILRLSYDLTEQINRLEQEHNEKEIYKTEFTSRKLLTCPWNDNIANGNAYIKKIATLTELARENNLTILTQQGILFDYENNTEEVFLVIEGEYNGDNLRILPKTTFQCMLLKESDLPTIPQILQENQLNAQIALCINTDFYDYCLTNHLHWLELQILTK